MSRTHSALGSVDMVADGIRCKLCPVTCGRPTRMLKATFKKLCDHHRNEQRESSVSNYNWKKGQKTSWCGECKGTLPPELELINKGELIDMAGIKSKGTCESCRNKNVTTGNNYGLKMCSSCAAVFSAVNNRFPVVAEAIKRTGRADEAKKLLGASLVEFAPVTVESTALEEIAAAVGYTGTDGDGLIDEVRRLAQVAVSGWSKKSISEDVIRALDCGEAEWEMAAIQSAAYMGKYRRELKASELLLDHIADVVSYPGKEVGTLPEFIERICQEFESVLAELANVKRATGLDIEEETTTGALTDSVALLAQTLDQYRVRCEELAAKAREHEQLASYREQILLAVKDALGQPLISVGETPYQVECLMQELEQLRGGADRPSVIPMSSADTVLLDLALDALRGNITGLDPDRIAMLREAV
jgi:hypothetical protein